MARTSDGLVDMHREFIAIGEIVSLVEINFTGLQPRVAEHPERGPCSTRLFGKMAEGSNNKTLGVNCLTLYPNTITTFSGVRESIGMVNPEIHLCTLSCDEPKPLGIRPTPIVDKSVGGINIVIVVRIVVRDVKVELVKEVCIIIRVVHLIRLHSLSGSRVRESYSCQLNE